MKTTSSTRTLLTFEAACRYVQEAGLGSEVFWQKSAEAMQFSESDLLRESAWVILCSGFKETAVRKVFGNISLSFCDWESAKEILESERACRMTALGAFRNKKKIEAIIEVARRIEDEGFRQIKKKCLANPISEFQKFPFIGPITAWHLAKNLGFDVAKPDRHLVRLSEWLGRESPHELCAYLSSRTGNPVKVVDLILWRFMADRQSEARSLAFS